MTMKKTTGDLLSNSEVGDPVFQLGSIARRRFSTSASTAYGTDGLQ
jgi:hypothetical protein